MDPPEQSTVEDTVADTDTAQSSRTQPLSYTNTESGLEVSQSIEVLQGIVSRAANIKVCLACD